MTEIRFYNRDRDHASIVDLMIECEAFHGAPKPDKKRFEHYLFQLPAGVEFLVAENGGRIIGFISFSTLYSAIDAHPQFFIKEIFVTEQHRQKSIGNMLMRELIQLSLKRDCNRIEWTTDTDNTSAQNFYEKFGAKITPKLVYRLEGEELIAAAKELG